MHNFRIVHLVSPDLWTSIKCVVFFSPDTPCRIKLTQKLQPVDSFKDRLRWNLRITHRIITVWRSSFSTILYMTLNECDVMKFQPGFCRDLRRPTRSGPVLERWWWSERRRCWWRRTETLWSRPRRKWPSPSGSLVADHDLQSWHQSNVSGHYSNKAETERR